LLVEKEINQLSKLLNPEKPFIAIVELSNNQAKIKLDKLNYGINKLKDNIEKVNNQISVQNNEFEKINIEELKKELQGKVNNTLNEKIILL